MSEHGSAQVANGVYCSPGFVDVDVRSGLPSVTVIGYPDRFSMAVARDLREWGWLPARRITIAVAPNRRRAQPSSQSVASYVQSLWLHAQRGDLIPSDSFTREVV